jgi:hypothetical protein
MLHKRMIPNKNGPATLDGSRADTKTAKALVKLTIGAEEPEINNLPPRKYLRVAYTDELGQAREVSLPCQTAKMLLKLWWKRQEGLSQAGVPKGFTLRTYIYDLATNAKCGYYMEFKREWATSAEGRVYRLYRLLTEIIFLAEQGFPEIRSHLRPKKG